jgi:RHS repeat-associated protein
MSAEECCLSAHAELPFGGSSILRRSAYSSSRKTRAWGVRRHPSGRNLRRGRFRPTNTPGLRACGYKTAPGRSNWPNRDPIGEAGGLNSYGFCHNDSLNIVDPRGLTPIGVRARRIRQYLNNGDIELATDEAHLLYINLAWGGQFSCGFASEMMQQWLDKKGPKTLDASRVKSLVKDDNVSKMFGAKACGATTVGNGTLNNFCHQVTPVVNSCNYYAVGTFTLCFTGKYCRKGNKIILDGKWDMSDTYDWHAGLGVTVKGVWIPDDWALLVEAAGKAQSYPVSGSWTGKQTMPCSGGGTGGGR